MHKRKSIVKIAIGEIRVGGKEEFFLLGAQKNERWLGKVHVSGEQKDNMSHQSSKKVKVG